MATNSIKKASPPDPTVTFKTGDLKHPEKHNADTLVLAFLYELTKGLYTVDPNDATKVIPVDLSSLLGAAVQLQQQQTKLDSLPDPTTIATYAAGSKVLPLAALPAASFVGFKEGPIVAGVQTYVPDPDTIAQALQPVAFEGYTAGPVTNGVQTYVADSVEFPAMLTRLGLTFTSGGGGSTPTPTVNGKLQNFKVGDSQDDGYLTSGGTATAWGSVEYSLVDAAKFGPPVFIAVAGETLLQQRVRVQNQLLPAIDTVNFRGAHIDLGAGTNDIGQGATAADVTARRKLIIQDIRAWQAAHNNFPITIAVLSMTKNGKADQGVSIADNWTQSSAANDDWLANYKTYGADYYSNYSADVRLTDPNNQDYFNPDKLHCNDAGHVVKAGLNKPILLAAYAGTALAPAANYVAPTNTGGGGTTTPPASGNTVNKYSADFTQVNGDFRETGVLGETILFSNALDAVATLPFTGSSFTLTHADYRQYNYTAIYDVYVDNVYDGKVDLTGSTASTAPIVRLTSKTYTDAAHVLKLVAKGTAYPAFLPLPKVTITSSGSTTTPVVTPDPTPTPTPDPTPTPTPTPTALTATGTKTYTDFTEAGSTNWRPATINNVTIRFTDIVGDSASSTFTGKQVTLTHGDYSANNFRALYDVYIDGVLDLPSGQTNSVDMTAGGANVEAVRFTSKVYADGEHTIMLVNKGFMPIHIMTQFS
jgi:hypothetical protein